MYSFDYHRITRTLGDVAVPVDAQKITSYANSKVAQQVGTGECYDFAVAALAQAGAKVAADYGVIVQDADYIWGNSIELSSIMAGDVLQYRDYEMTTTVEDKYVLNFPDGLGPTYYEFQPDVKVSRPHHTAIAMGGSTGGEVKVMEQNVERVKGGGNQRTVGPGAIRIEAPDPVVTTSQKQVSLTRVVIDKIKKDANAADKLKLEAQLAPLLGRSFPADVTRTVTVSVSGTLKAYRPQDK